MFTHLILPRGGVACGAQDYLYFTPHIQDVTCEDCVRADRRHTATLRELSQNRADSRTPIEWDSWDGIYKAARELWEGK